MPSIPVWQMQLPGLQVRSCACPSKARRQGVRRQAHGDGTCIHASLTGIRKSFNIDIEFTVIASANDDITAPEATPQRDTLQDPNSEPRAFCPDEEPSITTIPRSVSNSLAISLETTKSQVGSRIFLDLCAGYQRPLSSSLMHFHCDVCTFDILVHSQDDILDDTRYELLLRLACSRQVAYAAGSPSCNEYSRLKLRPGGPIKLYEHPTN